MRRRAASLQAGTPRGIVGNGAETTAPSRESPREIRNAGNEYKTPSSSPLSKRTRDGANGMDVRVESAGQLVRNSLHPLPQDQGVFSTTCTTCGPSARSARGLVIQSDVQMVIEAPSGRRRRSTTRAPELILHYRRTPRQPEYDAGGAVAAEAFTENLVSDSIAGPRPRPPAIQSSHAGRPSESKLVSPVRRQPDLRFLPGASRCLACRWA